jgi:hypothetical protein
MGGSSDDESRIHLEQLGGKDIRRKKYQTVLRNQNHPSILSLSKSPSSPAQSRPPLAITQQIKCFPLNRRANLMEKHEKNAQT